MQSFSRKTACAYGKYEQEIGFIFSEPEETGRKNATLQQENVKLRTELSKQERLIQSRSSYGFKGRFTYLFYCFDVRRKAFHREISEFVLIL